MEGCTIGHGLGGFRVASERCIGDSVSFEVALAASLQLVDHTSSDGCGFADWALCLWSEYHVMSCLSNKPHELPNNPKLTPELPLTPLNFQTNPLSFQINPPELLKFTSGSLSFQINPPELPFLKTRTSSKG